MPSRLRFLALGALCSVGACRIELGAPERGSRAAQGAGDAPAGRVMIYTSMYRQVIDAVTPVLKAELPAVEVEWLQAGSEKIALRLDAELAAGDTPCDLIMTSDPFWYERLKAAGELSPYASIRALAIPRPFVDKDGAYATSRLSTMVVAFNERFVKLEEAPESFDDLFSPRFRRRVTIPDPLASGTTFSTLAFLVDVHGLEIIDRMKSAEVVASGGNSSAFARLESGEQQVGFVLLENVLQGRRNGSPVAFRVPKDGAILIPGPIAILKRTRNPAAARAVYDLLLSSEIQAEIVKGDLHSPFEGVPPPPGAPALEALSGGRYLWTTAFVARTAGRAEEIKKRFADAMSGR
jgi:iron(III) transport system substrate-binding protein